MITQSGGLAVSAGFMAAASREKAGVETTAGSGQDDAAPGRRTRVLIVEDEYFVALAAEDALLAAGFDVVGTATSFDEAVRLARAERPDIALMDIRLAGARDGVEAAVVLLETLGIPSLFATANADAVTAERGRRADPLGWLHKPYSPAELVEAVGGAAADARRRRDAGRTS